MSQRRSDKSANVEADISVLEDSIEECVRYIVYRGGSKKPIKRAKMIKHLTATCQTAANQVNTVIIEANKILKRVHAYKLVPIEAESGIQYILVQTEEYEL